MNRRRAVFAVAIVAVVGLAAYAATVSTRLAAQPAAQTEDATEAMASWLKVAPDQREQVASADPTFAAESKRIRGELANRKLALANLLDDPKTSDEQVLASLEEVIAASNTLERRTAQYLLSVRRHLTPEQQKQLLSLCAEEVRQGRRYQRGRRQDSLEPKSGDQPGPRRGPGGQGRGRPWAQPQ
jgi:Spy/CpxP family protein refolding chaperone